MRAERELLYVSASEDELNKLLEGHLTSVVAGWNPRGARAPARDESGVLLVWDGHTAQPVSLVVREESLARLYGRFSHVRNDYSPLSAWSHILTPRFIEPLDGPTRRPELCNLEAAWAGLAVAEAQILSGSTLPTLKIAACLATQSFAVARAISLWPHIRAEEAAETYDLTKRYLRSGNGRQNTEGLRSAWQVLASLSMGRNQPQEYGQRLLADVAERLLIKSGVERISEAAWVFEPLAELTELPFELSTLQKSSPEQRLKIFDNLVSNLSRLGNDNDEYYAIAMLAGFVATIAAGGAPSLSLAENQVKQHPLILAWAYTIGGLGERITWTSSFEGLGRLVVRELLRPFHLDEPPICDFSFDELRILADPDLQDPLVHLRIKQSRAVQVALYPGVNVVFSLADANRVERPQARPDSKSVSPIKADSGLLALLADALAPYLLDRLGSPTASSSRKPTRKKKNDGATRTLPFPRK